MPDSPGRIALTTREPLVLTHHDLAIVLLAERLILRRPSTIFSKFSRYATGRLAWSLASESVTP